MSKISFNIYTFLEVLGTSLNDPGVRIIRQIAVTGMQRIDEAASIRPTMFTHIGYS